jgi:hypothetical protein
MDKAKPTPDFCYIFVMVTLRECFSILPGMTVPTEHEFTVDSLKDGRKWTVGARLYNDFGSRTRYIAFFIAEGQYDFEAVARICQNPLEAISKISEIFKIETGHPAAYDSMEGSDNLPFSGRVFLFVDQRVSDAQKAALKSGAAEVGVALEIRDRMYADYLTANEKPLAFISHDSRDKPFVRQLAERLTSMRCPVWYDEYSLKVGDSLRESIDKGLKETSKCVVVLSPNFISNPGWTKAEFNAAMNKHISRGGSVILPIWHNVSKAEVEEYSSLIVDTIALKSDMDVDELARKLFSAINPIR